MQSVLPGTLQLIQGPGHGDMLTLSQGTVLVVHVVHVLRLYAVLRMRIILMRIRIRRFASGKTDPDPAISPVGFP